MAYRDQDYRRSAVEFDDTIRTRTVTRSPAPPTPRSRRGEFEEFDVRIRERDGDLPDFLRSSRRPEAGPMVLRQRDADPYDRPPREPSPIRFREERIVRRAQSVSPSEPERERSRTRIVEKIRSPSVARRRSPSPRAVRYVEPSDATSEHIRIVERERERERVPSPSPSPPPAPPVIRGPVIEREVITHYTDIDHGMIQARPPSPPPAPRPRQRERERDIRETDIDIQLSKGRTEVEVDFHRSASRTRSKSRERRSSRFYDDDIVIRRDLKIEETKGRRRAHSAAPRPVEDDEAEYITSKVDSRGRMGEAWGGATKSWTIVDVPPGTERIRMDGVGGATTDTTWTKYSGVRRTKFIPERERDRDDLSNRAPSPPPVRGERVSVSVLDREREIEIDRRVGRSPAPAPPKEMWTEITKDLVIREAIEELGYEYEETDMFFYIMDYLKYDDVLQLTELSDDIRRSKRQRARESIRFEFDRERDYYEDDRRSYDRRAAPRRDERIRETEIIYDRDRATPSRYR
ncbi:uncharacterized protein TRIREDRAFT_119881 [Trichoderma reesei QM6a]|uniref:Predicted protein n=2 Tax=Hypocrea jecorina TaxID=51453 RepID=G0R6Y8_HYPJQ|nr:uncharacterized protein TRIREDRAFT_119881 [Trichoderma reesei QM6a]EGR53058.1 predicted protein [Trichoderma reesei QM6a]ETS00058.1 hypothetical protein M419DRAFT_113461 [Trichoderma reesei RUT C-30]